MAKSEVRWNCSQGNRQCSTLALRPQETPGRKGSIIWSPARTKSTWNQTLGDDMPRCWTSGEVSRRGTVGHYRVNNGRPGHTNGTGCALWSSANEHSVLRLLIIVQQVVVQILDISIICRQLQFRLLNCSPYTLYYTATKSRTWQVHHNSHYITFKWSRVRVTPYPKLIPNSCI